MLKKKNVAVRIGMALLATLSGCQEKTPQAVFVKSVQVVEPVPLAARQTKVYSGIVQEAHEISLGFKTAGQIRQILVKEGDFVREGQLLACLDDADYRLGLEALQIQYDQVKDEVERLKRLYEGKSVSGNDYFKAVAGLEQLEVQLQANRNKVEYTCLYAPVDAYVQSVSFSPAEMVDAGTPVFNLIDMDGMQVVVNIPGELYREGDRIGQVSCRSPFLSGSIPLEMRGTSPKADNNQLYKMVFALPAGTDSLTAGMNVDVDIVLEGAESSSLTLPVHCLLEERGRTCVFVLQEDGTVKKTPVKAEHLDGQGQAIVSEGLKTGAKVVSAGLHSLRDGEKVKVVPAPSKTNVGGLL